MDRKRIENIIIMILVLLNLFLLSVTATDRIKQRRNEQETLDAVTALLADTGISIGADALLMQETPAVCTVVRDFDAELSRMQELIGGTAAEDLGGSILFYRTERGQAVLRGTGEIDMLLTGESVPVKGSREKTAARLFAGAGIETDLWTISETDANHIDCCCLWNGIPVYNAKLGFDFSDNNLSMVSGTLVLNRETKHSTEGVMDPISALIRFLEIIRSEGLICSRLDALTPGYLMNVTVSGESTLTPVWRIRTDTGELYINALSGKTETVS